MCICRIPGFLFSSAGAAGAAAALGEGSGVVGSDASAGEADAMAGEALSMAEQVGFSVGLRSPTNKVGPSRNHLRVAWSALYS